MDWLMFWFWVGVVLILAAALVPNEKYNWGSLLYSAIDKILANREAKKYPELALRIIESEAKRIELENFYDKKILDVKRKIWITSNTLYREEDEYRREILEEALKEYKDELLEYETLFKEIGNEIDIEEEKIQEEKSRLGIKHL